VVLCWWTKVNLRISLRGNLANKTTGRKNIFLRGMSVQSSSGYANNSMTSRNPSHRISLSVQKTWRLTLKGHRSRSIQLFTPYAHFARLFYIGSIYHLFLFGAVARSAPLTSLPSRERNTIFPKAFGKRALKKYSKQQRTLWKS
jgi:hypothetical protein